MLNCLGCPLFHGKWCSVIGIDKMLADHMLCQATDAEIDDYIKEKSEQVEYLRNIISHLELELKRRYLGR